MKIRLSPSRLLLAAAVFHLLVTLTITLIGHNQILPTVFDRNGIAPGIASDGIKVREEAVRRSQELTQGQVRTWSRANSPFYVKLYSLCFATLGRVLGANVLSIEPINLLSYLAILVLVFYLAREFSDQRTALITATLVALWPSFLLHTTQLLKDPIFIAGMLAFVFVEICLLSKKYSWRSAFLIAAAGGLVAGLVWFSRDTMGELLIATALLAVMLMLLRIALERRSLRTEVSDWRARLPSLVSLMLLVVVSVGVTRLIPKFKRRHANDQPVASSDDESWRESRRPKRDESLNSQSLPIKPWTRGVMRINKLRQDFASEFSDAGSNVDTDVQIQSTGDVIRYLPRAVMIGYLAPFPNMWFGAGLQVSQAGRLLSGCEMLVIYLIEGLAIIGLWKGRRRFAVWFLWLVSALGLTSLGLVVLNIGALYRLRYVFIILLLIIAASGAGSAFQYFRTVYFSKAQPQ
jgi:hypothetical protein